MKKSETPKKQPQPRGARLVELIAQELSRDALDHLTEDCISAVACCLGVPTPSSTVHPYLAQDRTLLVNVGRACAYFSVLSHRLKGETGFEQLLAAMNLLAFHLGYKGQLTRAVRPTHIEDLVLSEQADAATELTLAFGRGLLQLISTAIDYGSSRVELPGYGAAVKAKYLALPKRASVFPKG